ncbi:hypothetical protein TIFTF001_051513, partial [Ficus carica]
AAPWDDGSHNEVQQINISYSTNVEHGAIASIQAIYNDAAGPVHGTTPPGFQTVTIPLQSEHIKKVSGYTGDSPLAPGFTVVRSLKFETDKQTYGPYGVQIGNQSINYEVKSGSRLVGFKGTSGILLHDIAVHIGGA